MIEKPEPLTKEQAIHASAFHYYPACSFEIGSRGGIKEHHEIWRAGAVKTWKTRPEEFSVSISHGLYAHGRLTEINNYGFCLPEGCPANKKKAALANG